MRVRTADWPPYMIVKDNAAPQGIVFAYLKLIGKRTGITFDYEVTDQPFAEFLESMQQHQGPDMAALIIQNPEREQYLSFTVPYIFSPIVIFAREQDDLILDIQFKIQHPQPVEYKGVRLDCGYRMDLIVEDELIIELKSVEQIKGIHEAQLLTYMKLSGIKIGLLVNCNVRWLKDGLKRFVL